MSGFDDFDVLAAEVMTVVAIEGQTTAVQRKIAEMLRVSASPSVVPHLPSDGRSERPRQVHESLPGHEFRKETA